MAGRGEDPIDLPEKLNNSVVVHDTLQGLLSGEYTRLGGVIRDQKGRLVELLTDASIEGGNEKALQRAAVLKNTNRNSIGDIVEAVKENKSIAIGVGIAAAIAGAIYYGVKATKKNNELPQCVIEYFDAIDKGEMNNDIIENVLAYLEGAKGQKITLTTDQFALIAKVIQEYTVKLAETNDIDISELESGKPVSIKEYLKIQKQLFEAA